MAEKRENRDCDRRDWRCWRYGVKVIRSRSPGLSRGAIVQDTVLTNKFQSNEERNSRCLIMKMF